MKTMTDNRKGNKASGKNQVLFCCPEQGKTHQKTHRPQKDKKQMYGGRKKKCEVIDVKYVGNYINLQNNRFMKKPSGENNPPKK